MKSMHVRFAVVAVLVLAVLTLPAAAQLAVGPNPGVYAPNENVFGMSYGDWSAAWWQYVLPFNNDVSPIYDPDGRYCNAGQGGPVFFLAGTSGQQVSRTCVVPAGKALMVPIANVECSTIEQGGFHAETGQEGRVCAASWAQGINLKSLKFTIDGKSVNGLENFRVQSPFFNFKVASSNNYLGTDGFDSGYSASDGYWVMVKPLSPGMHVIHFEAGWDAAPQLVTYQLIVTQ